MVSADGGGSAEYNTQSTTQNTTHKARHRAFFFVRHLRSSFVITVKNLPKNSSKCVMDTPKFFKNSSLTPSILQPAQNTDAREDSSILHRFVIFVAKTSLRPVIGVIPVLCLTPYPMPFITL